MNNPITKILKKKDEYLNDLKTLPARFRAEAQSGRIYSGFAKAAAGGVGLTAIGYTTKAFAWPYVQQQGDMGLPEIFCLVGGAFYGKKLLNVVQAKTETCEAPISVRAGLIAGVLSSALAVSPFREGYNDYWSDVTQEHVSAELLAEHITEFKNKTIRQGWQYICPSIEASLEGRDDYGYVVCP